jgi:hypothetical protein
VDDTPIAIDEARDLIPGRPTDQTIRRWITIGTRGKKLSGILRGGRYFVKPSAIEEFLQQPDELVGVVPCK